MATPYELLLGMALLREKKKQAQGKKNTVNEWASLLIRVGEEKVLIVQDEVEEITSIPKYTKVPGATVWLIGLASQHGNLLPLIDLGVLLGLKQGMDYSSNSRVLIVQSAYGLLGLIVDSVEGIRHYWSDDKVKTQHSGIHRQLADYCEIQIQQKDAMIPLMQMPNVINAIKVNQVIKNSL